MPLRSYLMAIAIFANEGKGKSMLAHGSGLQPARGQAPRTERILETLASILVGSIDTVPSFNIPVSRACSSISRSAASNAALLVRRHVAIVSGSGCVLAAMNRAPTSR
jgi:hypothetical protein